MEPKMTDRLVWKWLEWFWSPPWQVKSLSTTVKEEKPLEEGRPRPFKLNKRSPGRSARSGGIDRNEPTAFYPRGGETHRESSGQGRHKAVLPFRGKGYKTERRAKRRG